MGSASERVVHFCLGDYIVVKGHHDPGNSYKENFIKLVVYSSEVQSFIIRAESMIGVQADMVLE